MIAWCLAGTAAWALTWTEKEIHTLGTNEMITAAAIADSGVEDKFWIVYEIYDTVLPKHTLALRSYTTSTDTLGTAIFIDDHVEALLADNPAIVVDSSGDVHILYTDTLTGSCTQPGAGNTDNPGRIRHALYDVSANTVTKETVSNPPICTNFGKKTLAWAAPDDLLQACWTAKRHNDASAGEDNEVRCAELSVPGQNWSSIQELTGGWIDDGVEEDHAAVAADPVTGERRIAWHSGFTSPFVLDQVAWIAWRPSGNPLFFLDSQDGDDENNPTLITRPLDGSFAMLWGHAAADIVFAECPAGDAATCDTHSNWLQWNAGLSEIVPEVVSGAGTNLFPDLAVDYVATHPRYWAVWEKLNSGTPDIARIAHKCDSATSWTAETESVNDLRHRGIHFL